MSYLVKKYVNLAKLYQLASVYLYIVQINFFCYIFVAVNFKLQ